jgi:flavin reductase (DIM6/NTAB) family NADH-FMN oxidoreductase RutF
MVGICLENEIERPADLSLRFHERHGRQRLLGVIGLRLTGVVDTNGQALRLFKARSCSNFCLPRMRLFAHDLLRAYSQRRKGGDPSVPMDSLSSRSMAVFFICPRPVVLVSVAHSENGNIFPMNLMGATSGRYMAFALNSSRKACRSVERAGRAVLSNVPFDQAEVARGLGGQHHQDSVNWTKLPFATTPSAVYGIPTPCFAQRVREVEIEAVRKLGSHTLFVARVLQDMRRADGPQFAMIHGIYQARRLRVQRQPE